MKKRKTYDDYKEDWERERLLSERIHIVSHWLDDIKVGPYNKYLSGFTREFLDELEDIAKKDVKLFEAAIEYFAFDETRSVHIQEAK